MSWPSLDLLEGARLSDDEASKNNTKMKNNEENPASMTHTYPQRFIPGHSCDWVVELSTEANGVPYCGEFQNGIFDNPFMALPEPMEASSVDGALYEEKRTSSGISTSASTPSLEPSDDPAMPPFLGLGVNPQYFSALGSDEDDTIQDTQEAHPCVVEVHPLSEEAAPPEDVTTPLFQVPEKYFTVPKNVPLTLEDAELNGAAAEVAVNDVRMEEVEEDVKPQTTEAKPKKVKRTRKPKPKPTPQDKEYVTVEDRDVLFGRGGRSNHHPGNKIYRTEIDNCKPVYMNLTDKNEKTTLSNQIVDTIQTVLGGRFLAKDNNYPGEMWYVVDRKFARRKVAQALRENNTPEARAAKKAKYPRKKK